MSVDLAVSSKVSLRLSPLSRLIPLKDESWAVVVICVMMPLYWFTRLVRMACEAASATGAVPAPKVVVPGVEPGVIVPIVCPA